MKYKSNNTTLNSIAVLFAYAHGRTLEKETIFDCFKNI